MADTNDQKRERREREARENDGDQDPPVGTDPAEQPQLGQGKRRVVAPDEEARPGKHTPDEEEDRDERKR